LASRKSEMALEVNSRTSCGFRTFVRFSIGEFNTETVVRGFNKFSGLKWGESVLWKRINLEGGLSGVFCKSLCFQSPGKKPRSIRELFRRPSGLFRAIGIVSCLGALMQPDFVPTKDRFDESVFHDDCMLFSARSLWRASRNRHVKKREGRGVYSGGIRIRISQFCPCYHSRPKERLANPMTWKR